MDVSIRGVPLNLQPRCVSESMGHESREVIVSKQRLGALLVVAIGVACSSAVETSTAPAVSTSTSTQQAGSFCSAQVTIGFYADDRCLPGTEVGMRRYDTHQTCFSWTAVGSNAQENSATRFQCYRDRLCYTQHPNSLTCGGSGLATDKESRTDVCLKEPAGLLYSRILGGTDACPLAPAGFQCPASGAGLGNPGIQACTAG